MAKSDVEYLTVKAACELLGISPNTLRSWGANGKIQEYRHAVNNYRLYKQEDVQELLRKVKNPQPSQSQNRKGR